MSKKKVSTPSKNEFRDTFLSERDKLSGEREVLEIRRRQVELLREQLKLEEGLPFLYALKHYTWSRQVFETINKECFLVAANQLGKSTVAIRKNIYLATHPQVWPKYWPKLNYKVQKPNLFWYFYPSFQLATTEFETKWETLLPQGDFKSHPQFGWKAVYDKGVIQKIHFNSGVTIQFKAYSQKLIDLQAASVFHTTADEEMPIHILPEIKARLNATDGYFLMVFTATLGQQYWKETMEPSTKDEEKHPGALKIHASLYDSQFYEDGTPSHWTPEKIEAAKQNCPTEAEVQRRVYGRFVKSEGLLYDSFSVDKNMSDNHPLPKDWYVYAAVDPGTGGQSGHPAGILFLAVNPLYTKGRVFRGWRGDGVATSSQDILNKFRELRGSMVPAMQIYDYAAKDFFIVASGQGETFIPADKSREAGVGILNTLFKNEMLSIQRGDSELQKLVSELCTLGVGVDKRKAKDDLIDPLRYMAKLIPWDFSQVELPENIRPKVEVVREKSTKELRREFVLNHNREVTEGVEAELDYWSGMHGTFE